MSGRGWSFLAVSGNRQYAGNDGYSDNPASLYRYDSNVANSRHVAPGDLAIVRDTSGLLGLGLIAKVESAEGIKRLARCPICKITAIKKRAALSPAYRCNDGHVFEEPQTESVEVRKYEASYGDTWIGLTGSMSAAALRAVTIGAGKMNSIQQVDITRFAARVAEVAPQTKSLLARFLQGCVPEAVGSEDEGYVPSFEDRRVSLLRAIRARRGQAKFRSGLMDRYGARCMISGCEVMEIVEAAHIWPYRGEEDNALVNGLLLRSDLHTLYDLDLLGIEPASMVVRVAAVLEQTLYGAFAGGALACGTKKPSTEALSLRWMSFQERANTGNVPELEAGQ